MEVQKPPVHQRSCYATEETDTILLRLLHYYVFFTILCDEILL